MLTLRITHQQGPMPWKNGDADINVNLALDVT